MSRTIEAVVNRSKKTERIAPCGAPLETGGRRRLTGTALNRRIERQLRETELASWRLPLDEYACEIRRDLPPGSTTEGWFISRSEESLTATFTHRETGARIVVTEIWVRDDGEIIQRGSNYGDLIL